MRIPKGKLQEVIAAVVTIADESDAGIAKVVSRKADGTPIFAIIIVDGDYAEDVVAAIEAIEEES
jgi:hypothetical protein